MKKEQIEKRIIEMLEEKGYYMLGDGGAKMPITAEAQLENDLGMDSLDMIDLEMDVEKRLGIEPKKIEEWNEMTVREFAEIVDLCQYRGNGN